VFVVTIFLLLYQLFTNLWCGVVYCNILSFIVNALVLLTRRFFYLFSQYVLRNGANATNAMKATPAICYVPAIYDYSSHLIGWHPRYGLLFQSFKK